MATGESSSGAGSFLKRVALAAAIGVVALNVWTGSPLLALWIGSRVQGSGPPSMAAIAVFVVVFAMLSFGLYQLLKLLGTAYDRATGTTATVRRHTPWLRSMRGERELYAGEKPRLTAVERILVGMVILVFAIFEIWFFFFSTSPIDQRSGRGALPPEPTMASGYLPAGGASPGREPRLPRALSHEPSGDPQALAARRRLPGPAA